MSKKTRINQDNDKVIFAFDIGIGSVGEAVRVGNEIEYANALLINPEVGGLEEERERRRAYRTRCAHRSREELLIKLWQEIGEEPLLGDILFKDSQGVWHEKIGDERLKREFPKAGDDTIYTSCLLRILLLEGKPLEPWQIYKALHSAIQRRGYDANVPWRTKHSYRTEESEEESSSQIEKSEDALTEEERKAKEAEERISEFKQNLNKLSSDSRFHFPCYYDAYCMGLWRDGKIISHRFNVEDNPQQKSGYKLARGYVAPRAMVIEEVSRLLKNAVHQLPKLTPLIDNEEKIKGILFGKKNDKLAESYRSYPSAKEWGGLLAQKLPRFDNRCVGKCCLIPRFHVCKKSDSLFIQTSFLIKLVNFRYRKENIDTGEVIPSCPLTIEEIKKFYKMKLDEWNNERKKSLIGEGGKEVALTKVFRWTKNETSKKAQQLDGKVRGEHLDISSLENVQGRSKFSRPALAIVRELILSGTWEAPDRFRNELVDRMQTADNKDGNGDHWLNLENARYRLFENDLSFLPKMIDTNGRFYIPQISLAEKFYKADADSHQKIKNLIASCYNPKVRHRLTFFAKRFEILIDKYGKPDHVSFEFIREDFMGRKNKAKYEKRINENKDDKAESIKMLRENNIEVTDEHIRRSRLMRQQGCICIYTGKALCLSDISFYEIDHILPQAKGGPDSAYNTVLTTRTFNNDKGDRIPYDVPEIQKQWDSYEGRVKKILDPKKRKLQDTKKRKLLLATSIEDAQELAEKYTALAATAEIARLARDVVCLRMGWQPGEKGTERHVSIINGALTHRVATKYNLYSILGDGNSNPHVKNRNDWRHHALDAMIISYIPEWARDKKKTYFFKFPPDVHKEYFSKKLEDVHPYFTVKQRAAIAKQPVARRNKEMRQRKQASGTNHKVAKKVGNYGTATYKNLRKDKSAGKGQWYDSRSATGKGTRTNGCLLIFRPNKKIPDVVAVHAHTSPHKLMAYHREQGKRLRLLHSGSLISIQNTDQEIATKLGAKTSISKSGFGTYLIEKIAKNSIDVSGKVNNQLFKYRVTIEALNTNYKRRFAGNLLRTGGIIEFKEKFEYEKDKELVGKWNIIDDQNYRANIELVSKKNRENKVNISYKKLYKHIVDKVAPTPPLKEGGSIKIDSIIKAHFPDEPKTVLFDGLYVVKSFAGGMQNIVIQSNNGTQYRLKTKNLAQLLQPAHHML